MSFNGELVEIFSWLPASAIYKLSTVCKTLNELKSEEFFIHKQCSHMKQTPEVDFFLEPNQQFNSCALELHTISSDYTNRIPQESLNFLADQGTILASSNGLVCARRTDRDAMFLFNPTTKSYLQIPLPSDNFDDLFNLIFDCNNNGCLLMALMVHHDNLRLISSRIYSRDSNTWGDGGDIYVGERDMNLECTVKENDIIYMVSTLGNCYAKSNNRFYWPYIVMHDVKARYSRIIGLPKQARKGIFAPCTQLMIFKGADPGSICLVKLCKNTFTVWVMRHSDDPLTPHWDRIMKMRVRALKKLAGMRSTLHWARLKMLVRPLMKRAGVWPELEDREVSGFTVMNGRVLLFATNEKVYSYDLKCRESREVCSQNCGEWVRFASFSSTLRPCGSGAATLPWFVPVELGLGFRPRGWRWFFFPFSSFYFLLLL